MYGYSRKALRAHGLADRVVSEVTDNDVGDFLLWRRARTWRPVRGEDGKARRELVKGAEAGASILYRDRGLLAAVFGRMVKRRQLKQNPVATVEVPKKPKGKLKWLSEDDVQRLIQACGRDLRGLVLMPLYTGMRKSEVLGLRWQDISFGNEAIAVFRPKTGTSSTLALHADLADELKRVRDERAAATGRIPQQGDYVFVGATGGQRRSLRGGLESALKRAGLDGRGYTFHSLRHTYACHYLTHGSVSDLQEILGHTNLETTMIYTRAMSHRLRAGMKAVSYGGEMRTQMRTRRADG